MHGILLITYLCTNSSNLEYCSQLYQKLTYGAYFPLNFCHKMQYSFWYKEILENMMNLRIHHLLTFFTDACLILNNFPTIDLRDIFHSIFITDINFHMKLLNFENHLSLHQLR